MNNLIAAYKARLELEKRHWENHGWGAAATIVKYNSWQLLNSLTKLHENFIVVIKNTCTFLTMNDILEIYVTSDGWNKET